MPTETVRMVRHVNASFYLQVALVVWNFIQQGLAVMSNPQEEGENLQLDNTCSQVVPYRPHYISTILPMFHQEQRPFQFAGKEWVIKQQWDEIGVAAVVWESVRDICFFLFFSTKF